MLRDAARMRPVFVVCGLRCLFFCVSMCCAASLQSPRVGVEFPQHGHSPPCCRMVAWPCDPYRKGKGRASRSLTRRFELALAHR